MLVMTTYFDVPASMLITALVPRLQEIPAISPPEWSIQVKTGMHRERPPVQDDWWHIRSAAVLRKVAIKGPIGSNRISHEYGGPRNRGVKKNRAVSGSRNISRKVLQQLSQAGLIENLTNKTKTVIIGKVISSSGRALLDDVAHSIRGDVEANFPGIDKY